MQTFLMQIKSFFFTIGLHFEIIWTIFDIAFRRLSTQSWQSLRIFDWFLIMFGIDIMKRILDAITSCSKDWDFKICWVLSEQMFEDIFLKVQNPNYERTRGTNRTLNYFWILKSSFPNPPFTSWTVIILIFIFYCAILSSRFLC